MSPLSKYCIRGTVTSVRKLESPLTDNRNRSQLFRVCKNRNEEEHLCLVIRDQKVRRQIFEGCHVGPAGNHERRDRTQLKIQEKYYSGLG